jgi:hypothetical protein
MRLDMMMEKQFFGATSVFEELGFFFLGDVGM